MTHDSHQDALLSVNHLVTQFPAKGKKNITVVDDISFDVKPGEIVAIVGESGSGKSITSQSIMGLLKSGGTIANGEILYQGHNLVEMSKKERRKLRGKEMSMIFQEPMSSLNPMLRVKTQIAEALKIHVPKQSPKERMEKVIELLKQVEIPNAETVATYFPHQLSGGMRQRVMIAIALAGEPNLLIADEPTTALDVTTQAQILALIKDLNSRNGTGVIFITHDLSVVADIADRVLVMYAGKIVEEATVYDLFENPQHPYTMGLMKAMPTLETQSDLLDPIPGNAPDIANKPKGCPFHPRCPLATEKCVEKIPELNPILNDHSARCIYPGKGGNNHEQ
ncbi:ATP-binding cassette domain-containing protein [Ornithinibacillus sp. L9]|uniref:ATP-binding cassette domain-containing protein n=1 Tax=Ornithinibacillus caprae TaxID=2678566 RepID=A0A6N8FGT8_9BACI|nr:ABC transporter ATP-binding protein [Ornithinibacillus caprae]MUK88872.1 ATP-binding cassette domain-containing protein [Ornithinibacillus caprae]